MIAEFLDERRQGGIVGVAIGPLCADPNGVGAGLGGLVLEAPDEHDHDNQEDCACDTIDEKAIHRQTNLRQFKAAGRSQLARDTGRLRHTLLLTSLVTFTSAVLTRWSNLFGSR